MNISSFLRKGGVRLSFLLSVIVMCLMSYVGCQSQSSAAPFGSWGTVVINDTPSATNTFGNVEQLAASEGVHVAQKKYAERDSIIVEKLLISNRDVVDLDVSYRYDPRTVFEVEYDDTEKRDIGMWVVFAEDSAAIRFVNRLSSEGYAVDVASGDPASLFALATESIDSIIVVFALLCIIFLCALACANDDEKYISVSILLGERGSLARLRIIFRHAMNIFVIAGFVAVLFIVGRQIISGNNFAYLYTTRVDFDQLIILLQWALIATVVVLLAYLLMGVLQRSLIHSLQGKRPYVLQQVIAVGALSMAMLGSMSSISLYADLVYAQRGVKQAQEDWSSLPENTWTLNVPWLDEEKIAPMLHKIPQIVQDAERAGMDVLVSSRSSDRHDSGEELQVLWVNPTYLRVNNMISSESGRGLSEVQVFLPSSSSVDEETVRGIVHDQLEMEDYLKKREGSAGGVLQGEKLGLSLYRVDSLHAPTYDTSFTLQEKPVDFIVSRPVSSISGDNLFSYMTMGSVSFIGDRGILEGIVSNSDLKGFDFHISSPREEAESTLVQQVARSRSTMILVLSQLSAAVLIIFLVSYSYIVRNTKVLALCSIIGYSFAYRIRGLLTLIAVSVLLGGCAGLILGYVGTSIAMYASLVVTFFFLSMCWISAAYCEKEIIDFRRDLGRV